MSTEAQSKMDTTKTDDAINAIRSEVWMNTREAGKYIGKSEKEVKAMIAKGYFLLSSDSKFISKESLAEYLEDGRRHRLNTYLTTLRIDSQNEEARLTHVVNLKGLEKELKELEAEIKKTEDIINNLPHSKSFENEDFKRFAGKVWNKTYAIKNMHLVSNTFCSPVQIELVKEFTNYSLDDITKEPEAKPKQYKIRESEQV